MELGVKTKGNHSQEIEIPSKDAKKSEGSASAASKSRRRPLAGGHIEYQCESVHSGHCLHCAESGRSFHDHVTYAGARAVLSEYCIQTPAPVCYHVHRNPKLGCRVLVNIGHPIDLAFLAQREFIVVSLERVHALDINIECGSHWVGRSTSSSPSSFCVHGGAAFDTAVIAAAHEEFSHGVDGRANSFTQNLHATGR